MYDILVYKWFIEWKHSYVNKNTLYFLYVIYFLTNLLLDRNLTIKYIFFLKLIVKTTLCFCSNDMPSVVFSKNKGGRRQLTCGESPTTNITKLIGFYVKKRERIGSNSILLDLVSNWFLIELIYRKKSGPNL